jgi:hypothetical protein
VNEGRVPTAGNTTVRYYLSADTVHDASDESLSGVRIVSTLAPGAVSSGTVAVTVPSTVTVATYYLLACVNDRENGESEAANNCRASTTTIQVSPGAIVISP